MIRITQLKLHLCLVFMFLFLCCTAGGTTVQRLDFEQLTVKASRIVIGQIQENRSYWSPDGRLIYTDYTLRVDETLKGVNAPDLTISVLGGQIGKTVLHVSGMPTFTRGETALVFIETVGGRNSVLGLSQGKFRIQGNEIQNNIAGLDFADGKPGNTVRIGLDEMRTAIQNQLKRK